MMRRSSVVISCLLTLGLAGCRTPRWEAEGDLVAVDADGATIAHERVAGVIDATTTRFPARPASVVDGARAGARVRFLLERRGGALVLVALEPIGIAKSPIPGAHDHRPQHGGVVSETGAIHVEMAASPDGRVRVYLTDFWRRPVALAGTAGSIRLSLPDGPRTLVLADGGDALEARGAPFATDAALASLALTRDGHALDATVLLDLTGNRAGSSIVPQTGCVAPGRTGEDRRAPRCVVTFERAFSALGTTSDGAHAFVAISHGATSVWRLPEATLVMGVDPPPPVPVLPGQHEPDPRAIIVGPDGAELALAIGARLAVFDAATGRFRRRLDVPGGMIQSVAWTPGGAGGLLVASGDGTARLLDATDAHVMRTFAVDGSASLVAGDGGGRWAAIATEVGTIALVELDGDAAPRILTPSLQPVAGLAFAGDRLVSAGTDGTLRIHDPATGREAARVPVGRALVRLAVAPDARHAATADAEHVIRVHRLTDGAVVDRLAWHRATIGVLAWGAGATLVAGDNDGVLAVWEVPVARAGGPSGAE